MNIEKLKQLKKDAGYTNQMIAEEAGVPIGTVQKVFSGETKAPRYKTLKAIEAVLIPASGIALDLVQELAPKLAPEVAPAATPPELAPESAPESAPGSALKLTPEYAPELAPEVAPESAPDLTPEWKSESTSGLTIENQGEYASPTTDEASYVPEPATGEPVDRNLLNGMVAEEIIFVIRSYLAEKGITAYLPAPGTKVVLPGVYGQPAGNLGRSGTSQSEPEAQALFPDVAMVLDKSKITSGGIVGAPDLIIEVMDGETRNMQIAVRPDMYKGAGVREYWMIDTDTKNIVAYDFGREAMPSMSGFSGRVPVKVLGEDCVVNFAQVYGKVGFLFGQR